MLQKTTHRVVLNRAAIEQAILAEADGLFAVAVKVIEAARPPDAPPYGKGLVEGGGALAFVGRKKVAGTTIGGRQIKKPRQLKLRDGEVTAIAGWGFPARFVELGTLNTHAEPFLTPAALQVVGDAHVIVSEAVKRRLRNERSANSADISARITAAKRAKKARGPVNMGGGDPSRIGKLDKAMGL